MNSKHIDTIQENVPVLHPTPLQTQVFGNDPVGLWRAPALIAPNNFIYKSLSNWSFNIAVGCSHACRFCYVPSAATIKQGPQLKDHGVADPDAEWGDYVLLRTWDEEKISDFIAPGGKHASSPAQARRQSRGDLLQHHRCL